MYLIDKKVLVLGLGITGISTIKALYKLEAKIIVSDTKDEISLGEILDEISYIPMETYFNTDDMDLVGIDLIIKSPGIPPDAKIVKKAMVNNIEIITDIEFAFRITGNKNIIAITGTNGKTTCAILTGEILKAANYSTYLVGNIGTGILDKMVDANKDDIFVVETSSFQLEHTTSFKPRIGLITNITPDHIDWHGSFENYKNAKLKLFKNQDRFDYLVLNHDDDILRRIENTVRSKIIWFSIKKALEKGIYIEDEYIIINDGTIKTQLMNFNDLKILGKHNLENVLGCIGIALAMNIELETVKKALSNFKGVEHRIEFVTKKNDISFYNDSKGTNPEATIRAIEAMVGPTILIAGGYDKNSNFDTLLKSSYGKVKSLVLLGQTKDRIKRAALENDYTSIYEVDTMLEAVTLSYSLAIKYDNILLSPACASWDMYSNYQERGNDFKKIVLGLME